VRSKYLLDLEKHLNNFVFQKLEHVANIYFKGEVCPLATSIAESNHNMLKSLLKKETAQAKLQRRSVDIVKLIFVACEIQPVHQERLTLLSSHRRERRIATPSCRMSRVACLLSLALPQKTPHSKSIAPCSRVPQCMCCSP
jgi:hypothetical protein